MTLGFWPFIIAGTIISYSLISLFVYIYKLTDKIEDKKLRLLSRIAVVLFALFSPSSHYRF